MAWYEIIPAAVLVALIAVAGVAGALRDRKSLRVLLIAGVLLLALVAVSKGDIPMLEVILDSLR
ncbi:hypothetical protein [Amycolatopsis sp. lyj-23]|uniref:hypothetical protein n=1 Tax=Amycolatopsis sp. lyj-23 TaxID=2789283 RepID=UPI00397AAB21